MRRPKDFRGRLVKGWFVAIVALGALMACQGGTDSYSAGGDGGMAPPQDPSVIPVTSGNLALSLDRDSLMADGASFATATAGLTDARGIARFGWPVTFFADLGDITWIWSEPVAGGGVSQDLFPTSCLIYTNSKGQARCTLRSGFTRGDTFINANAGNVLLASTSLILTPQPGEARGVSIEFIGDSCSVPELLEFPLQHRVEVQVTRASEDPLGAGYPMKNVTVFFDATRGSFQSNHSQVASSVTDDAGYTSQVLVLQKDDLGKTATVVAFVNGSLPQTCSFVVGTPADQVTLTLDVQPTTVQAVPVEQSFTVMATVVTAGRYEIWNREIRFSTPIGRFHQSHAYTDTAGNAQTRLQINADEAGALQSGETITITAFDVLSTAVATATLSVGPVSSDVLVTLACSPATIRGDTTTAVQCIATLTVNGAPPEIGRGVQLSTGGGRCQSTGSVICTPESLDCSICSGETDSTGRAFFDVTYDGTEFTLGDSITVQAMDEPSRVTAEFLLTVSNFALEIALALTPATVDYWSLPGPAQGGGIDTCASGTATQAVATVTSNSVPLQGRRVDFTPPLGGWVASPAFDDTGADGTASSAIEGTRKTVVNSGGTFPIQLQIGSAVDVLTAQKVLVVTCSSPPCDATECK